MDSRITALSRQLTEYSCDLKAGERVLIEYEGQESLPLVRQLIKDVYRLGGRPFVLAREASVLREILMEADAEQMRLLFDWELAQMEAMDAYIGIRGNANIAELADVPTKQMNFYYKLSQPVVERRVYETKWVILRYPNASMAQLAGRSQESFERFFFDVCTMDYGKMSRAMDALVDLMNRTDRVRIIGPSTDLTFSIKGIPAVKCDGRMNLPDGEVYTAPVKNSVNGFIRYNACSEMLGFTYENVQFEVENGAHCQGRSQRHRAD